MRTSINIDDALLAEAMAVLGQTSKKATLEEGLRLVIRLGRQKIAFEQMAGFGWEGDLDAMREGRDY